MNDDAGASAHGARKCARHVLRRTAFRVLHPTRFGRLQRLRKTVSPSGYSYSGFDRLQCIFVHIPKCAGVSIASSLFGNLGGGHATLSEYRLVFDCREFNRYFKFAVVRNPCATISLPVYPIRRKARFIVFSLIGLWRE